jgi:hypothetical protein
LGIPDRHCWNLAREQGEALYSGPYPSTLGLVRRVIYGRNTQGYPDLCRAQDLTRQMKELGELRSSRLPKVANFFRRYPD